MESGLSFTGFFRSEDRARWRCAHWRTVAVNLVSNRRVTALSCVDSISKLGVVCVDDYPAVGRAIVSVAPPTLPVVMRVFDLQWVQGIIRTRFVERFSG